jgi:hypothetical protein
MHHMSHSSASAGRAKESIGGPPRNMFLIISFPCFISFQRKAKVLVLNAFPCHFLSSPISLKPISC